MAVTDERELQQTWKNYASVKSLQIVSALAQSKQPIGVTALSEITQIPTASVYRILQDLVQCEFAIKEAGSKTYHLGYESWRLGMKIQESNYIFSASADEIERLNTLTNETIHTIKLDGLFGVYIGKKTAKNQIGLMAKVGDRLPLYCTSAGKLLMAWQDEQWLKNYFLQVKMERNTSNTIYTEQAMRQELEVIRVRGYALDNRERYDDVMCIAAPVFGASGDVVCTIGISAPYYRFSLDQAVSYVPDLLESVANISAKLGGTLPFCVE